MYNDDLHRALCRARWEAPNAEELVRDVALALRDHGRIKGFELGLDRSNAWLVQWPGPTIERVPAALPSGSERSGRPRAGWGMSRHGRIATQLAAARRWLEPLPCRHASAYLVVWTGRSRSTSAALDPGIDAIVRTVGTLVDAHVLLHRVARLSRDAHADSRRLRGDLRRTLGLDEATRSPAMRRCLDRARAVAAYNTPVLVTGPSGSGKERLARRIHAQSPRVAGPFIQVNCGALPLGLVESELFGHERGAFTGAVSVHRGVFERAVGGTLLLDEIGDLPPPAQVKLLRVLQEGTFHRVGAESSRHSDARVIAATHRDLGSLVAAGSFREDLFYRLAVFEVAVPALRERPEDLPRLVHQLVEQIAARMGRRPPRVPRAALDRLAAHDWPGNVRELENLLESALVMSENDTLELIGPLPRPALTSVELPRVEPLEHSIRRAIEAALTSTQGRIYGFDGAAQRLGLKPGTLQSKMRKLGVDRRAFIHRPD